MDREMGHPVEKIVVAVAETEVKVVEQEQKTVIEHSDENVIFKQQVARKESEEIPEAP